MADTVRRVDYRYAIIDHKPGEGFKIAGALKEAGVNLLAFSAFPAQEGKAQAVFVTESEEALLSVAEGKGLDLSPRKHAFLIQGDDSPGALGEVFRKLADENINVVATDAVAAGAGRYGCILWVKPEEYDRAAKSLGA